MTHERDRSGFVQQVSDLAGASRLAAHDQDLEEIRHLLEKWRHLYALYHTAVIYHDVNNNCDCDTCERVEEIRALYPRVRDER